MKGYGDSETWPPCVNAPGDPRADDENHYLCIYCGRDIWTELDLDDAQAVCAECSTMRTSVLHSVIRRTK